MDCLYFEHTSQATNAMNKNDLYLARFSFFIFLRIFFHRQIENQTKPEIETPNFGGYYAMLLKNAYIQQNDLISSELLDNSFFLSTEQKNLAFLKHKQS